MKQSDAWPALALAQWKDSYATLHMWTQSWVRSAWPFAPRSTIFGQQLSM